MLSNRACRSPPAFCLESPIEGWLVNSNPIRFFRPRRSAAVPPERRSPVLSEPAFSPSEEDDVATPAAQEAGSAASVVGEAPRAERLVPAPARPDRGTTWWRAAAIAASVLLHIGVILLILARFPSEGPQAPPPIPVELAALPPPKPAPAPAATPAPKPPPQPPRSSGGDLEDRKPGASPAATTSATNPPAPKPPPTPPAPHPPAANPAPALPAEPSAKGAPVAPAASPRETQQAAIPTIVPPNKPPDPSMRPAAIPSPSSTPPSMQPTAPDMRQGEGGGDKYLSALRDDLRAHQVYPPTAELFRLRGVATYEIVITRQGQLVSTRLLQSSGYRVLDQAGFMTIRLSAPFRPVPPDIAGEAIPLVVTLYMGPDG